MAIRLDVLGRIVEAVSEADVDTDGITAVEPWSSSPGAPVVAPIVPPPTNQEVEVSTTEMGSIADIEVLGDYVLVKHLARGAMCDVWLALQMFLGELIRPVIIKRVDPELAAEPEFKPRFLRQAAIMDRVRSPYIAPVFELGMDAQSYFVSTAFVQGASVADVIAASIKYRSPIPNAIAARIASDALSGLQAIHTTTNNKGRVIGAAHHDLSAKSVVIGFDGRVQLSDTGMGKAAEGFSREQRWFSPYKARYKSPEQARGERGSARSDQYSIGVLLFEMVTRSVSPVAATEEERREILDALNPSLDRVLRAIILSALSVDPAHRFRSAADMKVVLEGAIREMTKQAPGSDLLDVFMQQRFTRAMTEMRIMLGHATEKAAAAIKISQRRADKHALDMMEIGSVLEESSPSWVYP